MGLARDVHIDALNSARSSRTFGRDIERIAECYLKNRGLSTVARNYACRVGEIDLVMLDENILVFVEVRYRRSAEYGDAAESVTRTKQRRLIRTAEHFLLHKNDFAESVCRFDVLAIHGSEPRYAIDWIEDAFSA